MRAYGVQNRLDAQKHPPDMGGVWVRAVFWEDQGRGKSTTGQYVSANKHFSWAKSGRRISIQASPDGFPERWPIQCFFNQSGNLYRSWPGKSYKIGDQQNLLSYHSATNFNRNTNDFQRAFVTIRHYPNLEFLDSVGSSASVTEPVVVIKSPCQVFPVYAASAIILCAWFLFFQRFNSENVSYRTCFCIHSHQTLGHFRYHHTFSYRHYIQLQSSRPALACAPACRKQPSGWFLLLNPFLFSWPGPFYLFLAFTVG